MSAGAVIAIVPAAGESRRMGALKPLLPYGSGTVIQAVVRSLRASPVDAVVVVLGHRAEEIAANLESEEARIVLNPRYQEGMLTSIQAGVAAAPAETEWLVIALADQPSLEPALVAHLLEEARRSGSSIVVPSWSGRRGHPLVLNACHRAEIAGMDPALGLRELLRRHAADIRHVPVGDEGVLLDMDTPADYQRELERAGMNDG